jgi:hypothetical protein
MAGYTGRPVRKGAGQASAEKIARADLGRRRTVNDKLDMVEAYIRGQARAHFGGDVDQVPCPDIPTWNKLCSGRNPLLPSSAQMGLFSTEELRSLGAELGGLRQAYFAAARSGLKRQAAKS